MAALASATKATFWMLGRQKRQNKQNNTQTYLKGSAQICCRNLYLGQNFFPCHTGLKISSVQFSHWVMSNSVTLWPATCQASLSITNSLILLKFMPIESEMPFNHFILCRLLLLPSIFPSIRVFSNESVLCNRWPKYWSFSFSISPSNEYSGLSSLRKDWLDLVAVQGTLKSLLQHHSSKASQRNNFSEPRLLHFPIHKRALRVNLWRLVSCVWIAIIFGCSLYIFFFFRKNSLLLPYLFWTVLQSYLRGCHPKL